MKILFLTSRFPYPPIGGDKLRVSKLIQSLSKEHAVTLFALSDENIKDSELNRYESYREKINVVYLPKFRSYLNCLVGLFGRLPLQVYYYRSKQMKRLLEKEIHSFDLIFVHLIRMSEYVIDYSDSNKVLDLTDAISLNYQRSIRYQKGIKYLISRVERNRVLRYEREIVKKFDKSLFVSDVDKKFIENYIDSANIDVLPVGVDTDYFSYSGSGFDMNEIVFMGNMRTYPNSDAAYYFADRVFPLIRRSCPEAKFTIAGANPPRRIRDLRKKKNVFVTGHVDDIRPYLRNAAVSVCPMRAGAGMQNKVLESMAAGIPVVTTKIGLEGIGAVPGNDILSAEGEQEFAKAVLSVLTDKQLREKISRNGRRFVEEKFSDSVVLDTFSNMIKSFSNCQ